MAVSIRKMTSSDIASWNAFVDRHVDGTFCHYAEWKTVIENGANHECPFLVAEDNAKIVGIMPLTLRKSKLFGNALISNMFCVYGGPLAINSGVYDELDAAAWELACQNGIKVLEYRTVKARHVGDNEWSIPVANAATFQKPLQNTPEAILLDIPRKQRAVVRKTLDAGLSCSFDSDIENFYKLYAESVRGLGTPVFPKKLFTALYESFGEKIQVQIIRSPKGQAIASLMSFYADKAVLPYYAGGNQFARQYGAHDFMYYQLMIKASEKGKTHFDFGRSKMDTGPYRFKKNWGFEPVLLQYETRLAEGGTLPDLNPSSSKYRMLVAAWKRLPLPIANTIGPMLARHLG
ncbi:FemAB family XrtA/PEP-CTERM system-associated protein [Kordiimonas pumila]|uniref:FemAB family XrtA/PEP-CTERM system-associated protein n=1 Tax=Kordiimonas pumila TaxID=2161677 RepID=A0ABV7D215_9PROT|nr:FemAB family XrtA/PEP-CTERM system-associated protein [Kordiimonas pumila]